MTKTNLIPNQKGLSVIAVTIALALLIILALVAVSLISVRSHISTDAIGSARAFYLAETGLSMTLHKLRADWSRWNDATYFPQTTFAGGTFDAEVTAGSDPDLEAVVAVTGIYDNSKRVIQSIISRYSAAMTSAVYTNAGFEISGSASVTGEVTQSDSPIPGLDIAAAIAAAIANKSNGYTTRADGNYFKYDFNPNPSSLNGIMFIDTLPNGNPANVVLSGNLSTTDGQPALLIIMGDLRVTGDVEFHGLIYTTGNATTSLSGNMIIEGALISSGDISMSGDSDITYNAEMVITDTTTSLLTGEDVPQEKTWLELSP